MFDLYYEKIFKTFFFLVLNDSLAGRMSLEVLSEFKNLEDPDIEIKILKSMAQKLTQVQKRNQQIQFTSGQIQFPKGFDLTSWREFYKNCPEKLLHPLCLCLVGHFNKDLVSQIYNLSPGALDRRLGKALHLLGTQRLLEFAL